MCVCDPNKRTPYCDSAICRKAKKANKVISGEVPNNYEKIVKWNNEHSGRNESLFVSTLVKKGLTYSQIVIVLEAVDGVCQHCFDSGIDCRCWDDS